MAYEVPPIPAGNGMRWERIWSMSDDFNRDGLHSMWQPYNRNWLGRKPSFFRPGNVTVRDGKLRLQARIDQVHQVSDYNLKMQLLRDNEMSEIQEKPMYKDFSTAFIRTAHRQLYGYFEIYCKMAKCDISSAFWLSHNEPNPRKPGSWWTELDVFEYSTSNQKIAWGNQRKEQESIINMNHHVHRFGNNLGRAHRYEPVEYDTGIDLSDKYHKYAIDWAPSHITWYFNDKPIRTEPNDYFHRPMHLQMDRESFPGWFGLPNPHSKSLPNTFDIDYVRSWERVRS